MVVARPSRTARRGSTRRGMRSKPRVPERIAVSSDIDWGDGAHPVGPVHVSERVVVPWVRQVTVDRVAHGHAQSQFRCRARTDDRDQLLGVFAGPHGRCVSERRDARALRNVALDGHAGISRGPGTPVRRRAGTGPASSVHKPRVRVISLWARR